MRTWPGLAALGAGLIHLGSAAGTASPVLVPLLIVGSAEVLWGVLALSRPVPPAPRATAVGTGAILLLTVVALLLPLSAARHGSDVAFGVPPAAFGGAGALDLVAGVLIALHLWGVRTPEQQRPVRFLVAAAVGAAVVAVVTTQSLAATALGGSMTMH